MIKCDKGEVTIMGTGIDIMADLACIIRVLVDNNTPTSLMKAAIKTGFDLSKEKSNKRENIIIDADMVAELVKRYKGEK